MVAEPEVPATAGTLSIASDAECLRPFVVADYDDGRLLDLPQLCPYAETVDDCDVACHSHRPRKTGPSHPLAVLHCHRHDVSFSVYPPGFTPHGRRRIDQSTDDDTDPSLLEVCANAADGPWPRGGGRPPGVWSTQVRLIDRAAEMTGMSTDHTVRDAWAAATGVALTHLAMGQRSRGFRQRSAAVLLVARGRTLEELLLGGYLAGLWGRPWRWERAPHRLRCLVPRPLWRIGSTTLGPRGPPDTG